MRDKSERIGKYGSVERYDTEHSGNPIGFTYVVLNEALSLFSNESSSETKRIASALVSLLCEGRACGYRIHLLSQSLRADSLSGSSSFGKILTNVDTIYAGRVSNKTEASIVGRQLDSSERSRLVTLPKHSFLMIQEGKVQSIFKPYYVDQLMMEGFLDKHFPKVIVPSEEELEITGLRNELSSFLKDPKIFSYLMDSDASGEYRWRIGREA